MDIDGEEQAVKLLKEIIRLWVTIRGFSIAGTWMKQYFHASKGTSKSKGLRKELMRKSATTITTMPTPKKCTPKKSTSTSRRNKRN